MVTILKTEAEIKEMIAAKHQEKPAEEPGYNHGVRDGWLHCLKWFLGD